jgi:hypothetical protein
MLLIREALRSDLPELGKLFDEYRQFYKLPEDGQKALLAALVSGAAARRMVVGL